MYSVFHDNDNKTTTTYEGYFPRLPGALPIVSMSWFLAKAHMANLVYTTEQDYEMVIKLCDELIEMFLSAMLHSFIAELILPVALSTQWTAVYDDDIQKMLGFYCLCSFVFDPRDSRVVHLGICPVQFSYYLKTLCTVIIGQRFCKDHNLIIRDWLNHIRTCTCDTNKNNGRMMLLTIIRSKGVHINATCFGNVKYVPYNIVLNIVDSLIF